MNLLPLVSVLESAGLGVAATSIFINMIPAECPNGILLRNKLQGTRIDYELPGYYKTSFQVIVRSENYASGEAKIASVLSSLTMRDIQVDSMYVKYMRPITRPVVFPLSNGNLLEFASDFDIVFTE